MIMGSHNNNMPYISSQSIERSLNLKPYYVPKSIADMFNDLETVVDVNDRFAILNQYLNKYKEELSRVEPHKRDLPQCTLLLLDAIAMITEKITLISMNINGDHQHQLEFEKNRKLVAEFLAWKKRACEGEKKLMNLNSSPNSWSPSLDDHEDLNTNQPMNKGKGKVIEATDHQRGEISSSPAKSGKNIPTSSESSDHTSNAKNASAKNIDDEPFEPDPTWKGNTRRTWTPELHARFVQALNHIGGPEAATPRQIREVMRVKGLTNDQVKSHLQKYRIHLRISARPNQQISGGDRRNPSGGAWYDPYNPARSDRQIPDINSRASPEAWTSDHHQSSASHHDHDNHYYVAAYVPQPPPPPPPPYRPNLAGVSAAENNKEDYDGAATAPNTNFAGWLNHFRASGDRV